MAKIICPNKQFSGLSASVSFVNGEGETDNPNLISWFKEHGYEIKVEKPKKTGKTELTVSVNGQPPVTVETEPEAEE